MAKKNLEVSQALRYMTEDYKMDIEGTNDISEEYALKILSDCIDKYALNEDLQTIFNKVVEGDQLQDHADIIKQSMTQILADMTKQINTLKTPEASEEYSDDNEGDLEGPDDDFQDLQGRIEGESSPSEMTNG